MAVANGMTVVMMVAVQVAQAGVNIIFKVAISNGVSLPVLIAYRFLLSTAIMVPLAFFFNRGKIQKMTWKIIFQGFLCGLFGGSLSHNLLLESIALTSATYMAALTNLLPAITFIVGIFARLEKLEFGTLAGKAKVFGTLIGIGGAMLFTFFKGFPIDILTSKLHILPNTNNSHVILLVSNRHVLGSFLAFSGCISYSIWIIIQTKMSETLPCQYTSTGLMNLMSFFQAVIYALCVERHWTQWKLGWDIRLWTVAYSGLMGTALVVSLTTLCSMLRGPLFVASFSPLVLIIVALVSALFLDENLYLGSILGAMLIVCGLYVVLWGKNQEMKITLRGLVSSEEIQAQKPLDIIVASGQDSESPTKMKKTGKSTKERHETVISCL